MKTSYEKILIALEAESSIKKHISQKYTLIDDEGIHFAYYNLKSQNLGKRTRYHRAKLFNGKHIRYHQKKGSSLNAYFILDDIKLINENSKTLYLTEGEKKLLSFKSTNHFAREPIISIPGCHNWKADGTVAKIFEEIPLKNRKVIFIGDSDYFYNPMVYSGYNGFIEYLVSRGAIVELIDLRDGTVNKNGADDYITKYGESSLLSRIKNPYWIFSPEKNYFKDKKLFSYYLARTSKQEATAELEKFISTNELKKNEKRKIENEALKLRNKWFKLNHSIQNEKTIVYNPNQDGFNEIAQKIYPKLAKIDNLYRFEGTPSIAIVKNNDYERITTAQKFIPLIYSHYAVQEERIKGNGEVYFGDKKPLDHKLAETLLLNIEDEGSVKQIRSISHMPYEMGENIYSNPGFNENHKIYYLGEKITTQNSGHLIKILDSFPFESEVDKLNLIGFLLGLFFTNDFMGNRPALIIKGDQPSLGKTTLAVIIGIIATGKEPHISSFHNEDEMRKQITSILSSKSIITIDNIKMGSNNNSISSPFLERLITVPTFEERILGGNILFKRKNDFLVLFTLNEGYFEEDLLCRSIILSLSGKDKELDYSFDPVAYSLTHRNLIIGELLNLYELAKKK